MYKQIKSFSEYVSIHKFMNYIHEMNKAPLSYVLYAVPSVFIILLVTTTVHFSNFISSDFLNVGSQAELASSFYSYIFLMVGLILLYQVSDAIATHVSYIQFKYYYTQLSSKEKFREGLRLFPSYLVQKLIQLFYTIFPLVIGAASLFILAYILLNYTTSYQAPGMFSSIIGLLMLLVIVASILGSAYYTIKYTYLSVFIFFTNSCRLMQIKQYRNNIKNKFISILIRVIILVLILLLFQLLTQLYHYLISLISANLVNLMFKIGGVLISTFISYFSAAYLYLTFKEEFESDKKSAKNNISNN